MRRMGWLLGLMLIATSAQAQFINGTILGRVTDETGGVIPDATVRVVNVKTNATWDRLTNQSGDYMIPGLPPGAYRIEVTRPGFKREVHSGIEVQVDQKVTIDSTLTVGNVSQTVDVTTSAPLLDTRGSTIRSMIDRLQIARLPLSARQAEQLAMLLAGVTPPAPGSHLSSRGGFNVAGQDEHTNSFFLDGFDNVDPIIRNFSFRPSVDFIQEFNVQQNGGSAEFGRNSGGVINVITRSGTNDYHGAFWEFFRNDNLDARNYFASPVNPKPQLGRNQFGGTLGGPIRPGRTFFFVGYEGLRQNVGLSRLATVPTLLMRAGDLTELGGGVIPDSSIHAIAREVIQAYPLPNLSGIALNRAEVGDRIENGNDVSLRIDHQLSKRNLLNARYSYSVTRVLDPFRTETGLGVNLSGFGQIADRLRTNTGVSLTTRLGNNLVNEVRVGYNRFNQPQLPVNAGTPGQVPLMGFEKAFLRFSIRGFDALGSGGEFRRAVNVYNVIENLSWTAGSHFLKAGIDVRRYLFNSYIINPNSFVFDGSRNGSGIALEDFLRGQPSQTQSWTGSPGGNARKTEIAGFLQDDWKVNGNLTVNAGIRWEYYGRIVEKTNKQSLWLASCNCMTLAGQGLPKQLVDNDFNNFAPRLGLAYRPFGLSNTVIRAFGGIFYDNDMRHNSEVIGNPPFILNPVFLSALNPGLSMDDPFPGSGLTFLVPVTLDLHYRDTYAESWSLGIQHEYSGNLLLDVSYVGNHTVKARWTRNLNQAINGVAPYPGFSAILGVEQAGSSSYNSLQVRAERRLGRSLSFMSSYTWGHAIDDRPGLGLPQNSYAAGADRGDSDHDVRHRWVTSGSWDLPLGENQRWGNNWGQLLNKVAGGWTLNGIATAQGGRPFTVMLARAVSNAANLADRPNLVPGVDWKPQDQRSNHWIESAAFTIASPGSFGNLGRNTLRGPRFYNLDLSLMKTEKVNERFRLEFRAEFFNLFNHPNFAQPSAFLDIPSTFGTISSTISPERQIQFGIRLEY